MEARRSPSCLYTRSSSFRFYSMALSALGSLLAPFGSSPATLFSPEIRDCQSQMQYPGSHPHRRGVALGQQNPVSADAHRRGLLPG